MEKDLKLLFQIRECFKIGLAKNNPSMIKIAQEMIDGWIDELEEKLAKAG